MFMQTCFFRKRPDMTMEQFMDYYNPVCSVFEYDSPMGSNGEMTRVELKYED